MNYYFGAAKCNISALLGSECLLRVDNGVLNQINFHPIYDIDPSHCYIEYTPKLIGNNLILEIITGPDAYSIEKLKCDCDTLPIGDKRVDDCTVNELLFAIQKKMGLIPDLG